MSCSWSQGDIVIGIAMTLAGGTVGRVALCLRYQYVLHQPWAGQVQ